MPLFRRILSPLDLPPEDSNHETIAFDAKGRHLRGYTQIALAEQIAAFANVTGGVILVGANEQTGGTSKYEPMSEAEAHENKTRYEQAAKDFCSPNPFIESIIIPYNGGFLVAINVWPFPGQAIGVRTGTKDKQSFVFPVRTGTQTKFLEAEQLPMLMLPELRKNAILLSEIPQGSLVRILDTDASKALVLHFVDVFPAQNSFLLKGQGLGKGLGYIQRLDAIRLPLDIVNFVWNDGKSWTIAIKGVLALEGHYLPPQVRPRAT